MEKQLLQAALLQARADEEPDQSKSKALVNRVLKIKEDITRAATARASSMSDQEERAVVLSCLKALQRGDTERASKTLEERLKKLSRRIEMADSDDDEVQPVSEPLAQQSDERVQTQDPDIDRMSLQDWVVLGDGIVHITDVDENSPVPPPALSSKLDINELWPNNETYRRTLQLRGFVLANGVAPAESLCEPILLGLQSLRAAGIPPFFIWMFDEAWQLARSVWPHAECLLGGRCVLEPTVAAYHLDYTAAQRAGNSYIGTNFSLPHRDCSYSDGWKSDGTAKALTVWVPVTEVTADNGCMFVIPREFDTHFDRDDVSEHMLVLSSGWLKGKSFLRPGTLRDWTEIAAPKT